MKTGSAGTELRSTGVQELDVRTPWRGSNSDPAACSSPVRVFALPDLAGGIQKKARFFQSNNPLYNQPNITSPSPGSPARTGNRGGGDAFLAFHKRSWFSSSYLIRKLASRFCFVMPLSPCRRRWPVYCTPPCTTSRWTSKKVLLDSAHALTRTVSYKL